MPIGVPAQSGGVNPLAENSIYQPLSTNGDGTGTISQKVDGSSTPVLFYIQPPSNEKYTLRRMNVEGIAGNWNNAAQYADLGGALTNGIKIYKRDDTGIIKDYTEFVTIKRTHDWALLAGVDSVNIGGAGEDPLTVRWTFGRGAGDIDLDGSKNERLVLEVADSLLGLTDQIAEVQGFRRSI